MAQSELEDDPSQAAQLNDARQNTQPGTSPSPFRPSVWRLSTICMLCFDPITTAWSRSKRRLNIALSEKTRRTIQLLGPELGHSNQVLEQPSIELDATVDQRLVRHSSRSSCSKRTPPSTQTSPAIARIQSFNVCGESGKRSSDDNQSINSLKLDQQIVLREIIKQRAGVYHEKLGVQEQTRDFQNKLNEVAKASALLQQELQQDRHNPVRMGQLNSALQTAISTLVTAENQMDYLNEQLMEREKRLKLLEDQLYSNLTGYQIQSKDDILNNILYHLPSIPNSLQSSQPSPPNGSHYSVELIETSDPIDNASPASQNASVSNDSRELPQDEFTAGVKHKTNAFFPDEFLFDMDQLFKQETFTPVTTILDDNDDDYLCVGGQFPMVEPQVDNTEEILEVQNARDMHVYNAQRKSHLASFLEISITNPTCLPLDLSETTQSKVSTLPLEHSIGLWLFKIFANSWLEFQQFIWLGGESLRKVFCIIGYINFSILVRENWQFEDTSPVFCKVQSFCPSNSSNSKDVPQFYQQIFVSDSHSEVNRVRHFHLSYDSQPKLVREVSNIAQNVESRRSATHSSSSSKDSKVSPSVFSAPKRIDTTTDFNGVDERKHSVTMTSKFQV